MKSIFSITRRTALMWLLAACALQAFAVGADLSAPEALAAMQARKLLLVDVRTPAEWQQTGVAAGAVRIEMSQDASFVQAVLKQTGGDKSAPVALICRSGNRSTQMQALLQAQGFTHVFNVREGMSGGGAGAGWLARGLPVVH